MQSIRKWDITRPETKRKCINQILLALDELEDDSEVGDIFAETLMQTISEIIGPDIYNMALVDTKKVVNEKLQDLDVDIDLLNKSH